MSLALGFVAVTLAGLAASRGPAAVHGGNEAQTCQLPMVVGFRNDESKCTGTLIHPRVVLTAAHCLVGPGARMRFGESFATEVFGVDVEDCVAHPDFLDGGAPAHDIGICRLAEPVQDVPRLPLLVGCEAEVLRPGAEAVIAGFGQADTDAAFGTKRYAFTVVGSELRSDGTVFVGDAVVNGCLGDSGGPAFIRMTDDTWRVAGVLTYGPECGEGVSLYASVPGRIAWLEEASGVDLTPCHDDDGQWAPTALCDTIPADPLAIGTWTNACAGPVVATAATCEPTDGTGGATSGDSATSGDTDFGPPLASTVEGCGCAAANPRTRALWLLVLAVGQPRRRGRSRSSSRPRDALNESVLRV